MAIDRKQDSTTTCVTRKRPDTASIKTGLHQALAMVADSIIPLSRTERVTIVAAVDRVAADNVVALVDSPSVDASLKDGYAVVSGDIALATPEHPVTVTKIDNTAAAGSTELLAVGPGMTVRILTGARIPSGADAVVAEEFVQEAGEKAHVTATAHPGRNILRRGTDVCAGMQIVGKGTRLTPGHIGLLAASGHSEVLVLPRPRIGIIATGDEVVAPGLPLGDGKLYASNVTTLAAWCRRYGMETRIAVCKDDFTAISAVIRAIAPETDALITSGGAWTGDRDMVLRVLESMQWHQRFHRVRIGPGKAVGFGLLEGKPIFVLPGGPPSNLMGFLQIALPGLLQLGGYEQTSLPTAEVLLAEDVYGNDETWTQLVFGILNTDQIRPIFKPIPGKSRLTMMAEAQAVVELPEGIKRLKAGDVVTAQMLN